MISPNSSRAQDEFYEFDFYLNWLYETLKRGLSLYFT